MIAALRVESCIMILNVRCCDSDKNQDIVCTRSKTSDREDASVS